MTDSKYAPKREDGTYAYVRRSNSWGTSSEALVYATTLAEARSKYGHTRQNYTTVSVRRADPTEASELRDYR